MAWRIKCALFIPIFFEGNGFGQPEVVPSPFPPAPPSMSIAESIAKQIDWARLHTLRRDVVKDVKEEASTAGYVDPATGRRLIGRHTGGRLVRGGGERHSLAVGSHGGALEMVDEEEDKAVAGKAATGNVFIRTEAGRSKKQPRQEDGLDQPSRIVGEARDEDDNLTTGPDFNTTTTRFVIRASAPEAVGPEGAAGCPCITPEYGESKFNGGGTEVQINVDGKNTMVRYESLLGAECKAWDDGVYPGACVSNKDTPGRGKGWCAKKWCYVDPCNCDIEPAPMYSYMHPSGASDGEDSKANTFYADAKYHNMSLFFSYAACAESTPDSITHKNGRYPSDAEKRHYFEETCVKSSSEECFAKVGDCIWTGEKCLKTSLGEACGSVPDPALEGNGTKSSTVQAQQPAMVLAALAAAALLHVLVPASPGKLPRGF